MFLQLFLFSEKLFVLEPILCLLLLFLQGVMLLKEQLKVGCAGGERGGGGGGSGHIRAERVREREREGQRCVDGGTGEMEGKEVQDRV